MRGRFPHIKWLRGLRLGTPTDGQVLAYEAASGLWKPASALPVSAMEYKGAWDASTNTPTLADGTGSAGDVYRVSAAASRNLGSGSIDFAVGDYVIYNGSTWEKGDTSDAVSSVNSETGAVSLSAADVGAIPDAADAVTASHIASNAVGASEVGSLPAARVYNSAVQSIPNNTNTAITLDSERWDTDGMHNAADTALTGTVAKTNGSATLTGTGTAFTTELALGQSISVPGGATETRVVTAIASDISLTVDSNFANTSSGQVASRLRSRLNIVTPGVYSIFATVGFAASTVGQRSVFFRYNGTDIDAYDRRPAPSTGTGHVSIATQDKFTAGDYVELMVLHNVGGAINTVQAAKYSPEFGMSWMGEG